MRHVGWHLGIVGLAVAALAAPAAAQLPRIGVPKGQLRVEIGSEFDAVNDELNDGTRPLHDAWNTEFGAGLDRNLSVTQSLIQTITADGSFRLSAGRSHIRAATTTGTAILSAEVGITNRLSLFGTLPFVRARWQTTLRLDSASANVGFNPADPTFHTPTGPASVAAFLAAFQTAMATLQTKINNGDYDGTPATKTLAQQTLANGTTLDAQLTALYTSSTSTFVPLATSPAGVLIQGLVDSLQSTLSSSLSVSGFTADPVFAAARLTDADLQNYLTNSGGPVHSIFQSDQFIQRPGDIELGADYTLVDRPEFRLAATGLVRLPTGLADRSDDFFDLGTGDGQTDIEGRLAADFTRGRFGARLSGGYNRQLARTLERRPESTPIAWQITATNVSVDPGDVMTVGIEPFIRLAPGFAFALGAINVARGADKVTFVSTGTTAPGANPNTNTTLLQAGLSYSSFAGIQGRGTPVEVQWLFREVVAASGGRVDKTRTVGMKLRVYYKLR